MIFDQKRNNKYLFTLFFLLSLLSLGGRPHSLYAQYHIKGVVHDASDGEGLPGCNVLLFTTQDTSDKPIQATSTSSNGSFSFLNLKSQNYRIEVRYIGYKTFQQVVTLNEHNNLTIKMRPDAILLGDVIVTARERKSHAASTVISKEAMNHIQASSLSDIKVFLPGGRSKDPAMGSVNLMTIRQAGSGESDHYTATLGTSVLIDGIPKNSNADMQALPTIASFDLRKKQSAGKGIDLRTISPDDIERIEVIRGLPDVSYGNLTNGVIKVERKRGKTPYSARIKTDQYGHLAFVGKGWSLKEGRQEINVGGDYYIAMADPRNSLENFKRLGSSIRYNERLPLQMEGELSYGFALNMGGNTDIAKSDPDNDTKGIDKYESQKYEVSINQHATYRPGNRLSFLEKISLTTALSYGYDLLKQHKLVQLDKGKPMPIVNREGEYDGFYLPYRYEADLSIEGKPFTFFGQLETNLSFSTFGVGHRLMLGGDLSISKNFGRGSIFDTERPVYPDLTLRPRPFNEIPRSLIGAFYLQDNITISLWRHTLSLQPGIRGAIQEVPPGYQMHHHIYWDPRISATWEWPYIMIAGAPLEVSLTASAGKCSMMPLVSELFPTTVYHDFIELNYYHNNPACRRLHMRTYMETPNTQELIPATNIKKECRLDLSYKGYSLSCIYFVETMQNGFRHTTHYTPYSFRLYDYSHIDAKELDRNQCPPSLEDMPYEEKQRFMDISCTSNGSSLEKQGFEWQFFSPRIRAIDTRITFSGAYYVSRFSNSQDQYMRPRITYFRGEELAMIGKFKQVEDVRNRIFSTNLTIDTYIKAIDFIASVSIQSLWLSERRLLPPTHKIVEGAEGQSWVLPDSYFTSDGKEHEFTQENLEELPLNFLVRNFDQGLTLPTRQGHSTNIDIKITKKIGKKMEASLFVNRIFDFSPPFKSRGLTIRAFNASYFGLEFNFKF